jgi:hypothetical protein
MTAGKSEQLDPPADLPDLKGGWSGVLARTAAVPDGPAPNPSDSQLGPNHPARVRTDHLGRVHDEAPGGQTVEVEGMAEDGIPREALPIPDIRPVGLTT